ncbi:MAG: 50S ribosomal protein L11 methyltransferase [Rhodanobacteraceae bacterium]
MAWLELSVKAHADQLADIEVALEELGALSITLEDAADAPILEPAPGETPVWPTIALSALFASDSDRADLVAALIARMPALATHPPICRDIADQDWTRVWMDRFGPMQFGRRLWIYPSTIEPPADEAAIVVRLDPGLAFGSGTHPTTALCLEWLDAVEPAGLTVIDYGCGSGVLAIAALKLGATHALGIDNDPQALVASRDNAVRNGVADRLDLATPENASGISSDLLMANILAGPLSELAPHLAMSVKPGGRLALSGILQSQQDELLERYRTWFENLNVTVREDWLRIDGTRRTH